MCVNVKLNTILEERNISHREFGRMTGIRHPTISDLSNNNSKQISFKNLYKICKALDCEITDILELKKEQSD